MSPATVDVVVVTHNSSAHLAAALASLPAGVDVVVVDNASVDASVEVARRSGAMVVANPVNAGFASAANRGARAGSGDLVLFLNPDAVLGRDVLERMVAALLESPEVAVVAPGLRDPDGHDQRPAWPFPSSGRAWVEALGFGRRSGGGGATAGGSFVVGACFLVRRDRFEAVGGFDERFWLYGEEADLCRRLLDAGGSARVLPDAEARHVGGASAAGIEPLVFEHFQRGAEHFVLKHEGAGALRSLRLAESVGSVARALAPGDPERRHYHRARLARLARVAVTTPDSVPLDSPATRAEGAGLVVVSLEAWDEVWRRNQFFVRELLEIDPNRRVLFVEPAFDVVHERRHPTGRRRRPGLRPVDGEGRVVRLEPVKVWPRRLGPIADRGLIRQVRGAADRLGFVAPDLWINDPGFAGLPSATGWPTTYDITDDWTEAAGPTRAQARVRRNEARLFAESGSVVVCSEGLASTRRSARPDLVVVPNAVDGDHLTRPRTRPGDLPVGPTAVYVGSLHEDRLDADLVVDLARQQPDLSVVLVGPSSLSPSTRAHLASAPNVVLLGARPYADVPGYLQHADVVLVPHVVTPFTESLDPIKAYECVALGRPTVSTPVAGFRELGGPIVSVDRGQFVAAVARVREETPASDPRPVVSWRDRAEAFAGQIDAARTRTPLQARTGNAQRPLRVVYVDHCAQLSGGELALLRLLTALEHLDAHVVLGEHGPLEARLRAVGATVEVLELDRRVGSLKRDRVTLGGLGPARALATGRDVTALAQRLRRLEPDLVHTNSLKAALYGGAAARLAGVPLLWHIRDRIAPDYLPAPAVALVRSLVRWMPDEVIVNSRATRDTLGPGARRGAMGVPVIYDMVEPPPPASSRSGPSAGLRIAMVGRLAPWKGQDVFIDAFARAFADGPEQAVIIGSAMFGEDDYAEALMAQTERLGLSGRVTFTGFVDDVATRLGHVDCLVHASVIAEPFGQVVVEGMAAGLVVIASDLGGPSEVVTDGRDGLLSPAGDVGALARRLTEVASDAALRQRLGAAAAERARDFYPDVVAAQVQAVYDGIGSRRRLRVRRGR